jgi:hypothetical protein
VRRVVVAVVAAAVVDNHYVGGVGAVIIITVMVVYEFTHICDRIASTQPYHFGCATRALFVQHYYLKEYDRSNLQYSLYYYSVASQAGEKFSLHHLTMKSS